MKTMSLVTSLSVFLCLLSGCSQSSQNQISETHSPIKADFYSQAAHEAQVSFVAAYETRYKSVAEFKNIPDYEKRNIERNEIGTTITYLFGPLTNREMGGPKRIQTITVDWSSAYLGDNGFVRINYLYKGLWIISNTLADTFEIPVPYNDRVVFTKNWLNCTDSSPEHQTQSFYWYFWDPSRTGCDQNSSQYQNVTVQVGEKTINQAQTFPEYTKLIQSAGLKNNLQMTFAFGYVEDASTPNPYTDNDYGMYEFQRFIKSVRKLGKQLNLTETAILEKEYNGSVRGDQQIGSRFSGVKDGVKLTINVVAAADIDQMELFAKSFAHDHDGFFGWFGHSRVGSGFDAQNFKYMVESNPNFYSIIPNYQIIYWGGCNSYSYYTTPFFKFKSDINPKADPTGTKGLDILANGLPSLFSFNAYNATVALNALLNWSQPTSYQNIVDTLENHASRNGTKVLVNILGDEDNSK